ncbi:MAG: thiamine pyrophosphate-binding protein [Candidatus Nanopelagicales bacterium]
MAEHATPTVAAAVLDLFAAQGVEVCFGIPGVHNLAFWDALHHARPSILGVRHEQSAVYAGDGLARATGGLGVALTTTGPGAANAVAAYGEAHSVGSPVLLLSSEVSAWQRADGGPRGVLHEMADQGGMFAAFGGRPIRVALTAEEAVDAAHDAVRACLEPPPGPVYLGIGSDVLAEFPPPGGAIAAGHDPPTATPLPLPEDDLLRLADLLLASERVVLWVGGGVVSSGTEADVTVLAELLGAPVVTTYAGKGVLAAHPLLVDAPPHEPEVAHVIADADLLLGLGSAFDAMNTRAWRMPVPPRLAAVTLGDEVSRTFDWDLLVGAELGAALPVLIGLLRERLPRPRQPWLAEPGSVRPAVLTRLADDPATAPAVALVRAVERGWPADAVVVCDMAVAGYWVGGYSSQPRTRRLQYPVGWGTLGYALPAAIGPASLGIPALAVCGDGGPMFALGELATYAQESLPVTLLVVDDGGYGMLRYDQQVYGHPENGVDLLTPDWLTLGRSFGIGGVEVPDAEGLAAALRSAYAANLRGEPRLVVVHRRFTPPRTTSPRWFED